MQDKEKSLNSDYIIQSLQIQLSENIMKIAERDALVTQHYEKIQELEKELEGLRKEQIKDMDDNA